MSKSAGNRSAAEESPALLTQRPRNEMKGSEKKWKNSLHFFSLCMSCSMVIIGLLHGELLPEYFLLPAVSSFQAL